MNKDFKVEVLKSKEKDGLGYTYDSFKIISKLPDIEVKKYCMEVLLPSFHINDMPHPHVHEMITFKNITNLNNDEIGDVYFYEVRKLATR